MIPEEEIIKAFESEGIKIERIEPLQTCSIVVPDIKESISIKELLNIAVKLGEDPGSIIINEGYYELEILI